MSLAADVAKLLFFSEIVADQIYNSVRCKAIPEWIRSSRHLLIGTLIVE